MKSAKKVIPGWQKLTHANNQDIHEVLMHQYFAAQFIALVGHHLIPQRDDDSNTSMTFHTSRQQLVGEGLHKGKRLTLHLPDLSIRLMEDGIRTLPEIFLDGLDRDQAFKELKLLLNGHGVKTTNFSDTLHYELPEHPLSNGAKFNTGDSVFMQEVISHRHNAELVIQEVLAKHTSAEPVRIWPHHFDTGSLIPATHDESGQLTGSVGVGWAIPDGMIDEPYYYISIWTKDPLNLKGTLPDLGAGSWLTPNWNGAVLRLSEIIQTASAEDQYHKVKTFLTQGIDASLELINK